MLEKVMIALEDFDAQNRETRAQRIVWLANYEALPSVLTGRAETLHILNEARGVFVNGHFSAALLLSMAVIEHSIVEELQIRKLMKIDSKMPFSGVLSEAEQAGLFQADWYPQIKLLVARRNSFAHHKEMKHTLGARIKQEKNHPNTLMEQDAKEAVKWMYQVFRATLRTVG